MLIRRLAAPALAALSLAFGAGVVLAQRPSPSHEELKYVVIVSRHGIRPPTWTNEQLNTYSRDPWPQWDVPPGHLTSHGAAVMKLFGDYDRALFAKDGLLEPQGCADAGKVHIWADIDERTVSTGKSLSEGMFPGCGVKVNHMPDEKPDPIFSPIGAGVGRPDKEIGPAALLGRLGGHPEALLDAHRPALELLEQIMLGCRPGVNCSDKDLDSKQCLLTMPTTVGPAQGDKPADMKGPLNFASTLAEDFLLEYTNGMEGKDLGWGRLDEARLRQVMSLHIAYSDLLRRTPYIGRVLASNLLAHVLKSMEQAVSGKAVAGAMGKPGDRALVIVGHDGNLSNIAGALDISWLLPGYQPNDTPPGGALVFELWQQAGGEFQVRSYYTAQTLEQMRKAVPLTLEKPPLSAPVFLEGCSAAGKGFPCSWKGFQKKVEGSIDPSMVKL